MSDEIKIFDSPEFGKLRINKDVDGELWFVASDISKILGYRDAEHMVRNLSNDEKRGTQNLGINRGRQNTTTINESGFYRVIMARRSTWVKDPSKRETVEQFQRWVTHEVLPAIRRDGGYMVAKEDETPEQLMARALKVADATMQRQQERIIKLEADGDVMRPKAFFADAVTSSRTSILVGDLAKLLCQNGINIGQKRLFSWLRDNGYLIKQKGLSWNMPTQRSADMGLFEVKERSRVHSDGHVSIERTTVVTGKGQIYFINKFCKGGATA